MSEFMPELIQVASEHDDDNVLNQATVAWLTWNTIDVKQRIEILDQWSTLIKLQPNLGVLPSQIIDYHNQQATTLIADEQVMPGPTGESNVLSASGRGVFILMAEEETPITAFIGLLNCALVAGNSVIIKDLPEYDIVFDTLQQACHLAGVAMPVFKVEEQVQLMEFINDPTIAGLAYVGNQDKVIELNRALAARDGQIALFIFEIDLEQLEAIRDQHLVLRFITEKTLTTNITAVGGNATLLALGNGDE